jgi:hypothetical protein
MLENNIYNIDREFDYVTIKNIVLRSLQNIAKEEASKKRPNDVIFDSKDNDDLPVNVNNLLAQPTPLLKLKIRNTTKYLNWRLSILKSLGIFCAFLKVSSSTPFRE